MSIKVKLDSLIIHGNRDGKTGEKFDSIKDIDFDHDPPLQLRVWDPVAKDTVPPANDPRYIVPRLRASHRRKTAKKDIPAIAKAKRLSARQNERHEQALNEGNNIPATGKFKRKIQSPGFDKKNRKKFDGTVEPRT